MNREILFRGKRKDNGEWVYGYYVFCRGRRYILPTDENGFDERYDEWAEVDPESVDQYTGCVDKKEKRVFEDDIIKYEYDGKEHIDKIVFEDGLFSPSRSIRWGFSNDEVIGNIHDNPELGGESNGME